MKKHVLFLGALIFVYASLFAQTDYNQYEVIYLTPKLDKIDLFKKGLAAHNKKYHAKAPYKVSVSSIITGPNSGGYVWVMGPTTWTELDGAPGDGEHMLDWEKNVNPYCETIGEEMFWRGVKDVYYAPEGASGLNKSRMRAVSVYPGQMERFTEQMKKVAAVYKQKKYTAQFSMAIRQGASQGTNAVTFSNFSKWAWFDENTNFIKDFDEVHGVDAYRKFSEEISLCLDRSKTYDELSIDVPELGG